MITGKWKIKLPQKLLALLNKPPERTNHKESKMKSILRSSVIFTFSMFLCLSAFAQSRGTLRGVVVDARGAAVRGARVILMINSKQAIRETITDEQGKFGWDGLKPGAYSLSVE